MKSLEAVDLFLLISSLQICNQAMEATVRKGTIPVYLAGRCRWKGGAVMGFGHHGKFLLKALSKETGKATAA
jgi:hypothetical protein